MNQSPGKLKGIYINSGRVYKRIKKNIKFKAKIAAYSKSIGKIFNVEVGFFERLDAAHELLEVSFRVRYNQNMV